MTTKICTVCNQDKPLVNFSSNGKKGYRNQCKQCRCSVEKQRRQNNLEKYRQRDKEYHEANKAERNLKARVYREKNSEKIQAHALLMYEITKEKARQRYIKNKQRILDKLKEYAEKYKERRSQVRKIRLRIHPNFRIRETLVGRMSRALHRKQRHKMSILLGETPSFVMQWLESMFWEDISWSNYGKVWHIDHVVPIAFFDLTNPKEQLVCFHWTNLRPLLAKDNLEKNSKIRKNDIQTHLHIVKSYCMKLERYQTDYENSWWQRLELWYGKNPEDTMCFEDTLKWVIRNQSSIIEEGSTTK